MRYCILLPALFLAGYIGINYSSDAPSAVVQKHKKGYVCWAKPTNEALKKCRKNNTCSGAGTWAWHPKKKSAESLAVKTCNKEFGQCILEYCEENK